MTGDNERPQSKRFKLLLVSACLLIVALLIVVSFLLWKYANTNKGVAESDSELTTQQVIAKVDKIYLLPKGEQPTVAQIQDKNKLSGDQQFYKYAEDGDYVLIYSKAKLAILYREPSNRLINVAPVSLDKDSSL